MALRLSTLARDDDHVVACQRQNRAGADYFCDVVVAAGSGNIRHDAFPP
jgi:hypothetical protein